MSLHGRGLLLQLNGSSCCVLSTDANIRTNIETAKSLFSVYSKDRSRQVTAFRVGLGSRGLERVVIPYANSPSTNPVANSAIISVIAELKQEIFKLLFNSAELANFTADERAKYQLDMTTERDIKNQIEFARDEGREEGRVEGIRLSALNMLKDNLPVDTICRYTGLSEEEVEALRS